VQSIKADASIWKFAQDPDVVEGCIGSGNCVVDSLDVAESAIDDVAVAPRAGSGFTPGPNHYHRVHPA
jgi:hypothetical protein